MFFGESGGTIRRSDGKRGRWPRNIGAAVLERPSFAILAQQPARRHAGGGRRATPESEMRPSKRIRCSPPGPITRKEREDGRNAAAVSKDGRPSRLHEESSERREASELRGIYDEKTGTFRRVLKLVEKPTDMPIAPMTAIIRSATVAGAQEPQRCSKCREDYIRNGSYQPTP